MSVASDSRQAIDGYGFDDGRPGAARVPALRARALARVRQVALDRRLVDGADASGDRALAARGWQITRVRSRERLARTFEEILIDIDRWRPERGARVPICRREVEVARCEILPRRAPARSAPCGSARGRARARAAQRRKRSALPASANDEL